MPQPQLLRVSSDHATLTACTQQMFDNQIDKVLGSETIVPNPNSTQSHFTNSDIAEAYANFITDVAVTESDDVLPPSPKRVQMCLKDLQPYREKPSKDRSKRFAVGDLPLTSEIDLPMTFETISIGHYIPQILQSDPQRSLFYPR